MFAGIKIVPTLECVRGLVPKRWTNTGVENRLKT